MVKFSLIIPVYNVCDYLEECLDSVVNQMYDNYEVIVVNDGSTDDSLKIAKRYEKKYPKLIKVYDKKNGGLSDARNYGIKKASGEYLFFIDSDDCILPDSLKILDNKINGSDILVYNYLTGLNIDNAIKVDTNNSNITSFKERYVVSKPCATNKVCRRELFLSNDIEFPVGLYYEDLATMPKLVFHAKKIVFIDEALYFYRVRETSIMNEKKYNPKMDSIFEVLDQLKKYFNGKYNEEIEYLYIEHLLRGASLRYFDCGFCREQLEKIVSVMRDEFPKWMENRFFKKESLKRKVMCYLFYKKCYILIRLMRK